MNRLRLGVNVDHVATLRNARGTRYPDPVEAARCCAAAGADNLTVHLREDRRHIVDEDVRRLCSERFIPVNLEMALHPDIVDLAVELRPEEVCLVPERRQERTTEGGLDAAGQAEGLREPVRRLGRAGVRVSLFIEASIEQIRASAELGVPCIELHTGHYCDAAGLIADRELSRLVQAAGEAHRLGLQVNAGHGIHLGNLPGILRIPHLHTLNIGHSIVARAIFVGIERAVREMIEAMTAYRGEAPGGSP